MKIETGYLYFLKDEFYNKLNDDTIMSNKGKAHSRPTYFTIRDKDILWFIPLSSKVDKYQKIIKNKVAKYGSCKSILIGNIAGNKSAILIQNAFPALEKYVGHIHTYRGKPFKIVTSMKEEILENFKYMLKMKSKGINLFFTDIDRLKAMMIEELKETN